MEIWNYCPECKNLIGATKMAERYRDDAEKLQQEVDDLMRLWRADGDIIKAYRETCQKFEAERDEAQVELRRLREAARVAALLASEVQDQRDSDDPEWSGMSEWADELAALLPDEVAAHRTPEL